MEKVCYSNFGNTAKFYGSHELQPKTNGGGTFRLEVKDNGEPGIDEDKFELKLFGDVNKKYEGELDGGNIQVELLYDN